MKVLNMREAKSSFSRLVQAVEQGREREIIIARAGHPVAKLVPLNVDPESKRIGVAKGLFDVPDNIDTHNNEVAELFLGPGPT
ncbi:type II toxin-antitoxin system Phd/YefM family antitoxin [Cupriavidus sp. TMH.W2]|uniref:type II toxin-antitoxin system Phd/YefM family antitoxin n=1 Tax=Cupriavidus sp. TMH.W2 TaxID=3434465 RepID=UPI003D76E965